MRIDRWMFTAAAAALLFGACAEQGQQQEEESEPTVETTPPPTTTADSGVAARVMADPTTWAGRSVMGEVEVAEVVSPRAFWITDQNDRLFVILEQAPTQPLDLQTGQVVRLQAHVEGPSYLQGMAGEPLDDQARQTAEGQTVLLVADGATVEVMPAGTTPQGLREGMTGTTGTTDTTRRDTTGG